jgi:hypothetical protein
MRSLRSSTSVASTNHLATSSQNAVPRARANRCGSRRGIAWAFANRKNGCAGSILGSTRICVPPAETAPTASATRTSHWSPPAGRTRITVRSLSGSSSESPHHVADDARRLPSAESSTASAAVRFRVVATDSVRCSTERSPAIARRLGRTRRRRAGRRSTPLAAVPVVDATCCAVAAALLGPP